MIIPVDMARGFADQIFEAGIVQFDLARGFTMAVHEKHPEAPKSPFYIDLGLLRSFPSLLDSAATLIHMALNEWWEVVDLVSDVPRSSTPLVTIASQRTGVPMISPRMEPKDHGLRRKVIGQWLTGDKVAVIDDLRTTGESKEKVVKFYREFGLRPVVVGALIDRGNEDDNNVAGLPFISALRWSRILAYYLNSGRARQETVKACGDYPALLGEHLAACGSCR